MAPIPPLRDRRPLTGSGLLVYAFCPDCQATVMVERVSMDADTSDHDRWSWDPAFTHPVIMSRRYQLYHGDHSWTTDQFTGRTVTFLKVITR